ncbi:MAG TPA: methyltransferase domain-containing protein [Myxococcales bacterium]|nr:methyltransferase domain-containing protein [Myxococcales bacterium]
MLCELCGEARPRLVVDLGSGTGLSTRWWSGRARRIVGIEPDAGMRRQAEQASPVRGLSYRAGTAARTGLPPGRADVVTAVQALHWFEPEATFAEVARLLRPGGVFAAIDCDWPPLTDWRLDRLWEELFRRAIRLVKQKKVAPGLHHWEKAGHLVRLRESGRFRFVKELCFASRSRGGAADLLRLAESQGELALLLRLGRPEIEQPLAALRRAAARYLGDRAVPWTYAYRVRVAVV